MREIITLHIGPFSNLVGAHYWNAQNELLSPAYSDGTTMELDPTILFSQNKKGDILPRALFIDVKDSLGMQFAQRRAAGIRSGKDIIDTDKSKDPYDDIFAAYDSAVDTTRGGDSSTMDSASHDTEDNWGHILRAGVNAHNLVPLGARTPTGDRWGSEKTVSLSSTAAFDAFTDGFHVINETIEESFRHLLEETDGLQGIQLMVDVDSGYGGLGLEFAQYLNEELPRTAIISMLLQHPLSSSKYARHEYAAAAAEKERQAKRWTNWTYAFNLFAGVESDLETTVVPLAAPAHSKFTHVPADFNAGNASHAASFLAYSVDCFSSSYRRSVEYHDGVLEVGHEALPRSWAAMPSGSAAITADEMAALERTCTMSSVLSILRTSANRRIMQLSTGLPVHMADASVAAYDDMLCRVQPAHHAPHELWSCVSTLFSQQDTNTRPPYSHMIVARGVGSHAISGSSYAASLPAYGHATDKLLQRTQCHAATHALLRTPLPVAEACPNFFGVSPLPMFVPSMTYAACGPAIANEVASLRHLYDSRDRSVGYRFAGDHGTSLLSAGELSDGLSSIVDMYCADTD